MRLWIEPTRRRARIRLRDARHRLRSDPDWPNVNRLTSPRNHGRNVWLWCMLACRLASAVRAHHRAIARCTLGKFHGANVVAIAALAID